MNDLEFTHDNMQYIAELPQHIGYQLVLTRLNREVAEALERVSFSDNDQDERRAVSDWRALKQVVDRLNELTSWVAAETEMMGEYLPDDKKNQDVFAQQLGITPANQAQLWQGLFQPQVGNPNNV